MRARGGRRGSFGILLGILLVLVAAPGVGARVEAHTATTRAASISISPLQAGNEVGTTRTLTISVAAVSGTLAKGTYTALATVSNSGGAIADFVGTSTPGSTTCTFTDTSPSCTVQVTSPAAGTTRVSAEASIVLTGDSHSYTVATGSSDNTAAGGSGPAALTWVQAVAAASPNGATNAVGDASTITLTAGSLGAPIDGPSTFAASITGGPGAFIGPSSCSYTPSAPTCTLVLGSSQSGVTTLTATTTISVGGVALTRSATFTQTWVDGRINLSAPSGAVAVNGQQTVTATVAALGGALDPGTYTASFTISKPGAFVTASYCSYSSAQPSCSVTVTAGSAGTATLSVSSAFRVAGVQVKRATGMPENSAAGGSDRATMSWSAGAGSGSGGGSSSNASAALSLSLSPRTQSVASGGTARFTITVTNTGAAYVGGVSVADTLAPHCAKATSDIAGWTDLAPGASTSYTCSVGGITAGFTNTAVASGQSPRGDTISAGDNAQVTVAAPAATTTTSSSPAATAPVAAAPIAAVAKVSLTVTPPLQTVITRITHVKTASGHTITVVHHGTAHFTIRVTNRGTIALMGVKLLDPAVASCSQKLGKLAVATSKAITCTRLGVVKGFKNLISVTATAKTRTLHLTAAPAVVRVKVKR